MTKSLRSGLLKEIGHLVKWLMALLCLALSVLVWTPSASGASVDAESSATLAFLPQQAAASFSQAQIAFFRKPSLTVALLDTLVNPFDSFYLQATIARLERSLSAYDLKTITISAAEAEEDIARAKPDFLFAPSGFVGILSPKIYANVIATRKTMLAEKAEASVGAAFVVRSGERLETLESLRGKRAATGIPLAIDGWLAAAGEIHKAGFEPEEFFSSVAFRNNAYPDVISALLAKRVDVAILPACLLETMRDRMLIDAEGLTVAGEKKGGLACRHSTALYPDVAFLALPNAPEEAVRDATIAILSDRNAREYEWLTNVSFSSILSLFKDLQLGPYAYLRDMSPAAVFKRHRTEFLLAGAILLFLIMNEIRLHRLVRRRTEELAKSVEERARVAAHAETVRRRLALFERRSIVQQMSGMIAHEINAPIGAIRTFAAILRMSMGESEGKTATQADSVDPRTKALEGIEREAVRIAEIVARVRRYAKTATTSHKSVDIKEVIGKSMRALAAERPSVRVALHLAEEKEPIFVLGDALELELLFLNLLRNAAQAAEHTANQQADGAFITVSVVLVSSNGGVPRVCVRIENEGPQLDEAVIAELNSRASGFVRAMRGEEGDSKAAELGAHPDDRGLGLGLTICRGIADSHGASLRFEAREQGGARVTVVFDRVGGPSQADSADVAEDSRE